MPNVPWFPKVQFMLVKESGGTRRRFFYGEKLKDAMAAAGIKPGDKFTYVRFERGAVQWGEMVRKGVIATTPYIGASSETLKRKKVA